MTKEERWWTKIQKKLKNDHEYISICKEIDCEIEKSKKRKEKRKITRSNP